ncbi:MAG TPA: hypothetical protein VFK04_09540 [Gemmatimonadaceae bacterium]|nr:hypothetical protein [Gemmatimonadaceae bacterium]
MAEGMDRDSMACRACGREERASEGYPCAGCGTFICIMCNFRGVTLCAKCAAGKPTPPAAGSAGAA